MTGQNIITAQDAAELVGREDVSFVDASWYLPAQGRNGHDEYLGIRIPGACYFDIDKISDPQSGLPHMLADPAQFARDAGALGISHDNTIIVYDGPGLFSSPRVWWNFRIMGARDVRVLAGGFDRWKENGFPVETDHPNPRKARVFKPDFDAGCVLDIKAVENNIKSKKAITIDARPGARFRGETPEPRPGLRSGHIPGSKSLPLDKMVINGELIDNAVLEKIFKTVGIGAKTPVITSCGSGITAAVLYLALAQTGHDNVKLFDGSWAQWGLPDGPEVETG